MRKLELNVGELLEMRKQGMSNKEIAKSLDVSVQTVFSRIGSQGRNSTKAEGVSRLPKKEIAPKLMYIEQTVAVNGYVFMINHCEKTIRFTASGGEETMRIKTESVDDLISALKAVNDLCLTE